VIVRYRSCSWWLVSTERPLANRNVVCLGSVACCAQTRAHSNQDSIALWQSACRWSQSLCRLYVVLLVRERERERCTALLDVVRSRSDILRNSHSGWISGHQARMTMCISNDDEPSDSCVISSENDKSSLARELRSNNFMASAPVDTHNACEMARVKNTMSS
jgi:hypothetical protein